MKKIFIIIGVLATTIICFAQETVYPAKENKGSTFIKNATIHVGNGKLIENGIIKITNGKIEQVGTNISIPTGGADVVDARGKHVYPGLILPISNLGLIEVSAVRDRKSTRLNS